MKPILFVLINSLITVYADYQMKIADRWTSFHFALGMFLYIISGVFWYLLMKEVPFSKIGAIYGVVTVVGLAIIGVVIFKETLTPLEILGVVLGIISVIILAPRFA